jgi:hypothetical protein
VNPRSPQVVFSALGSAYGATQFLRGLSAGAPWLDQMVWVALFVVGALLTIWFLRSADAP